MVDSKELTLREAKMKSDLLEEGITFLENRIDYLYEKTQPKASDIKDISVQSSIKNEDKFLNYLLAVDEEGLIDRINILKEEQKNYIDYINRCLKIMGTYGEIEKQVVYYKEEYLETERKQYGTIKRKLTWEEIAKKTHFSKTHCRRIYRNYKKQRNV